MENITETEICATYIKECGMKIRVEIKNTYEKHLKITDCYTQNCEEFLELNTEALQRRAVAQGRRLPSILAAVLLWWREKMHNASTAADCAEMQRLSKIGCFLHFGETGDSPDTFIFYFQHNIVPKMGQKPSLSGDIFRDIC